MGRAIVKVRLVQSSVLAIVVAGMWPANAFGQEAKQKQVQTPTEVAQAAGPVPDASTSSSGGVGQQDIVVTAEKRSTTLQRTPLAISAISGADLARRQITGIASLAAALPNVNFGVNVGFARIAIRGLGLDTTALGQEGRVAFHLDGVYLSRPTASIGTLFDVSRVEVVRGPQGTLYGRNATAGAINVITNDPTPTLSGYGRFTAGNYGAFTEEAAIGGPVTSKLGVRVAIQKVDRDGYGYNPVANAQVNNEHTLSTRVKARWDPTTAFDLTLSADYRFEDDHNFNYYYLGAGNPNVLPYALALGGVLPTKPRDSNAEAPTVNDRNFYGFSADANWDLGFAKLSSISAFRSSRTDYDTDVDSTTAVPGRIDLFERSNQISEELRLSGSFPRGDWIVGAYYFHEHVFGADNFSPFNAADFRQSPRLIVGKYFGGDLYTDAYAGFGQARYEVLPHLSLSLGGRYSSERKRVDEFASPFDFSNYDPAKKAAATLFQRDSVPFHSFTPRVSLEYKPSSNLLAYVTYSQGFKSGGYNLGTLNQPYFPEKLTDYEGGLKLTWLGGRATTNLSVFYYDYTNLQVQKVIATSTQVINAASARLKGAEVEFTLRPIDHVQIDGNASYLDSEYRDFQTSDPSRPDLGIQNLSGNRLSQAPRYTINLGAQYNVPVGSGAITVRGEASWVDRVYFSPFNQGITSAPAHGKYNAFVTYELRNGLSIQGFIRNIGNQLIVASSQVSSSLFGYPILGAYEPPRTYGATLGYKF